MNNLGWECPKCHKCYSPSITECGCKQFIIKQDYPPSKDWTGHPVGHQVFCKSPCNCTGACMRNNDQKVLLQGICPNDFTN